MAMTYEETAELMNDTTFKNRMSIACVNFARYITDEPANTPAHSTRYRWAQSALASPSGAVMQIIPTVVTDPEVQADGAAISDADLQTAVETAVNKLL